MIDIDTFAMMIFVALSILSAFAAFIQVFIVKDMIDFGGLLPAAGVFALLSFITPIAPGLVGALIAENIYSDSKIEHVKANWGPEKTVTIDRLEIKHMNPSGYVTTMDGEVIKYSLLSIKGELKESKKKSRP